jgi:hypothetical protein
MNTYSTKAKNTGLNKKVSAKTPSTLKSMPDRTDPSLIGKIYQRDASSILNLQELPDIKMDANLFTNESGRRGILPRAPTNFDYLYVRPEKDDIMAGIQAPSPTARGHKVSALTETPIVRQLPPNNGSYLK